MDDEDLYQPDPQGIVLFCLTVLFAALTVACWLTFEGRCATWVAERNRQYADHR